MQLNDGRHPEEVSTFCTRSDVPQPYLDFRDSKLHKSKSSKIPESSNSWQCLYRYWRRDGLLQ